MTLTKNILMVTMLSFGILGCVSARPTVKKTEDKRVVFDTLYGAWRSKWIYEGPEPRVINSWYPAYTQNKEFRKIVAMGVEAIPYMADKLAKCVDGNSDYNSTNWCDICFVYAIVEIMDIDTGKLLGVKSPSMVPMELYARRVLEELEKQGVWKPLKKESLLSRRRVSPFSK